MDESEVKLAVAAAQGTGKTFAEFLAVIFEGKFIEIYLGDAYEDISIDQISMSYPTVFCGKVIAAYRECLVLSSAYVDKKTIKLGNMVFINERAIRALNEVDGNGTIEDMMLRSKETVKVKDIFHKKHK